MGNSQKDNWQDRIKSILEYGDHSSALDVSGPIYMIVSFLEKRQSY